MLVANQKVTFKCQTGSSIYTPHHKFQYLMYFQQLRTLSNFNFPYFPCKMTLFNYEITSNDLVSNMVNFYYDMSHLSGFTQGSGDGAGGGGSGG